MRNKILIYLILSVVVIGLTPTITSAASLKGWAQTPLTADSIKYPSPIED